LLSFSHKIIFKTQEDSNFSILQNYLKEVLIKYGYYNTRQEFSDDCENIAWLRVLNKNVIIHLIFSWSHFMWKSSWNFLETS